MIERTTRSLVIVMICLWNSFLVPVIAKPQHDGHIEEGPCIDCLHGVLMHDDQEQGVDHNAEDQYLRFKDVLETGTNVVGPGTAEEEYHGVLMHGDAEAGQQHDEQMEMKPENRKEALPKDINQELHERMHDGKGVDKHDWDLEDGSQEGIDKGAGDYEKAMHGLVMHGDFNNGKEMHLDDNVEEMEQENVNRDAGDHEKVMHNLLMHGDFHGEEDGHKDKDDNGDENGNRNVADHGQVMHGLMMHGDLNAEEHDHAANTEDKDNAINRNAGDHEKVMHDLLMHGDINEKGHEHTTEKDDGDTLVMKKDIGDHEKLMHGLLMHGDSNFKGHAAEEEVKEQPGEASPKTAEEQLHGVLMHGDTKPGQHHEHGSTSTDEKTDDNSRGPSTDQLHGILMHGDSELGDDHSSEHSAEKHEVFRDFSKILEMELGEDLLKIIDIEKILRQDIEEYADWKVNNPKHEDSRKTGSTYLDASLLKDIEMMKQRYLNRDDKVDESIMTGNDDIPFTAEDANSVLSEHAISGEGEDMRHDLELAGSTEPINARHKMKLELLKAKEKEDF